MIENRHFWFVTKVKFRYQTHLCLFQGEARAWGKRGWWWWKVSEKW